MGTIPHLAIQPQAPTDPLDQYGKLLSVQHLGAQQQLQQAQIQNAQLETQSRQLEFAQQQRDANDQQVINKAFMDSAGDPQKFPQLIQQYGGSFKASQQVQQGLTARQTALANMDEATFKATKEAQGILGQHLQSVLGAAPEDQPAQYTLELNAIKRNPQLAKYAGSLPPQFPGLDTLKQTEIGLGMSEALYKQADEQRKDKLAGPQQTKAEAEAGTAQSEQTIKAQEAAYGQKGGAIPGIPLNIQQANDWLPKHPGKTLSDYVPPATTLLQGNLLGPAGQGSALDQAAERYSQTNELPAGFSRSPGTTAAIIKRSSELHPDQVLAANKATFNADSASLKKLQTNFDQVSAFESTAGKNLDLFLDKLGKIPDLGVKFANVPMRLINDKMIGTDNYQAMKAAQQVASAESAKVLSSANASGVLSDSQKKEAEDMLSGNLSYSAAKQVVGTLKQDFGNRHFSYQNDIDAIKQRLNPKGQTTNQNNTPPPTSNPSGLGVSLSAAKALPVNKGKSDDEIRADIKAHGHSVIE